MKISKTSLGTYGTSAIYQYNLINDHKMEVTLLTIGAVVKSIYLPFPDGTTRNVVLSFADWNTYLTNPLYAGATLAPNAGRISNACLPIGELCYELSCNEASHNAHGGFHNASTQNWREFDTHTSSEECAVTLSILLPDGLDGYPGNRTIRVTYTLGNDNTLSIRYHAMTDKETYFNLSNHSYFNLSGNFKTNGLDQLLQVNASDYVANNAEHIPDTVRSVKQTPFDFSQPISLVFNISSNPEHEQLKNALGYNNAFLLAVNSTEKALSLTSEVSGYTLELFTDAPSIVLYSGGYIGCDLRLADGSMSSASCAIALEAQDVPDTPHFLPKHYICTKPGEEYSRSISYHFIRS